MQKLKYFMVCLLVFCTVFQSAVSLERDYFAEEYCCCHQQPSIGFSRIQQYASLIPGSRQCLNMQCSVCHNAWVEFYEHDDEDSDDGILTEMYWNCQCKEKLLRKNYRRYWDKWMPSWVQCKNGCIYDGYLSRKYTKYASCFYDYLQYVNQNQLCGCFWPEISKKAAVINDTAYILFRSF